MKRIKMGLLPKIIIAIILGIATAQFMPDWWTRLFLTFNSVFSSFLNLFVPVLILGLVAAGISDLRNGAGKMLLLTLVLAYVSTIGTGFFSYYVSRWSFASILQAQDVGSLASAEMLKPYFTIEMPAFISVMSALVVAFVFGLAVPKIPGNTIKKGIDDLKDVVMLVIEKMIIPLLPIYIYGIFLGMTGNGGIKEVMMVFAQVIGIIFAMHIFILLVQYLIAGLIAKKNPFRMLWTMLPAYATALGTSSSAATIPVTLAQTKKNGVSEPVADFCIPLCATVHMPCSILKIVSIALAVCIVSGIPVQTSAFTAFIFMLAVTAVAAPGIPGGVVMAAVGLLQSCLGFDETAQGIVIALYLAIDSFGTAGNVTGDCALSTIVDYVYTTKEADKK